LAVGEMHVSVDEPGEDRREAEVDDAGGRGNLHGGCGADVGDALAADENHLVLEVGAGLRVEQPAGADGGRLRLRGVRDRKGQDEEKRAKEFRMHGIRLLAESYTLTGSTWPVRFRQLTSSARCSSSTRARRTTASTSRSPSRRRAAARRWCASRCATSSPVPCSTRHS